MERRPRQLRRRLGTLCLRVALSSHGLGQYIRRRKASLGLRARWKCSSPQTLNGDKQDLDGAAIPTRISSDPPTWSSSSAWSWPPNIHPMATLSTRLTCRARRIQSSPGRPIPAAPDRPIPIERRPTVADLRHIRNSEPPPKLFVPIRVSPSPLQPPAHLDLNVAPSPPPLRPPPTPPTPFHLLAPRSSRRGLTRSRPPARRTPRSRSKSPRSVIPETKPLPSAIPLK
jgi:hypothetical protein